MDSFDKYSESISLALKQLNKRQMVCFGAWSLFPFTKDKEIMNFIESLADEAFVEKLIFFIQSCWREKQTDEEVKNVYKILNAFIWDNDKIPIEKEDSSQGAIDFLGGVQTLSQYILKGDKKDIQCCVYNILTRIEYKIDFHNEDDMDIKILEDLYSKEMKNQLKIIEDISKSKKGELPIELHHEELIMIFAKY